MIGPLQYLTGVLALTEAGCPKLYGLGLVKVPSNSGPPGPGSASGLQELSQNIKKIVFFVKPEVVNMTKIAKIIKRSEGYQDSDEFNAKRKFKLDYTIIFSPRRNISCKEALERA